MNMENYTLSQINTQAPSHLKTRASLHCHGHKNTGNLTFCDGTSECQHLTSITVYATALIITHSQLLIDTHSKHTHACMHRQVEPYICA